MNAVTHTTFALTLMSLPLSPLFDFCYISLHGESAPSLSQVFVLSSAPLNLSLHRTKLSGADDFYDKHAGTLLTPSPQYATITNLVRHEFNITEKSDIVFAGLGWISIPAGIKIAGWAPQGVSVLIRKAMI